jgi:hypothetical protein
LRPLFGQKGNTVRLLRQQSTIASPGVNTPRPNFQYYGLASDFDPLALTTRLNIGYFSPFHIILDGEYVKNLAFNQDDVARVALNNFSGRETDNAGNITREGVYDGGDTGYLARVTIGNPELKERGDWNLSLAYKYLESDAILDAFADSDFGLGGTNLQGYIIGGKVALSRNVWTEARWMSADEIAGAPFAVDIFMLDINAKF